MQNESDLLDTDLLPIRTTVENPPVVCEAAPMAYAIVICFASCIGSSRVLELSTNRKSALFRRGDLVPTRRRNLYLPNYGAALACSHFRYPHRHRCHLAMDFPLARSATGLPCSAEMTRSVRPALYAGSVDYP